MATCLHNVYHSQFLTPGLLKMPWINVTLQLARHCNWEKVWLSEVSNVLPSLCTLFVITDFFFLIWNFLLNCNGIIKYSAIMYNVVLQIQPVQTTHKSHCNMLWQHHHAKHRGFCFKHWDRFLCGCLFTFGVLYWLCPIESKFLPDYSGFKAY